jgi:hypothetical protein
MVNPAVRQHFAEQAVICDAYGSPFTARLIERMTADLDAGGPSAALVGDWAGPPRADQLAIRVCGALHAAVLTHRDPALAATYPAPDKSVDMDAVWRAASALLLRERDWVARFIQSAPQTNEVRRSIALLAGFLAFAAQHDRELELLEVGASAGLNQCWDRFSYRTSSWSWGPKSDVLIDTDWQGPPPQLAARPRIHARAACDLNPLDITDPAQRTHLRSYIWADQFARLARFDAAADLAAKSGVRVERADAADWLTARLAQRAPDLATVIYHSVFLQYPPREKRSAMIAAIEAAGERATAEAPLCWLRYEPEAIFDGPRNSVRFCVDMITWPGAERRVLAFSDGHASSVLFQNS